MLQSTTAPGSPAEAYALFQLAFAQAMTLFGGEIEPSHVYLTNDGVLLCVMPADCVYAADLEVVDGQLANFTVDGNDIAPRLGRPGQPETVGPATARVQAAYRAVTGTDALRVFVELSSSSDATFELSNAVYVDSDGNLIPVDRDTSVGAIDGTAHDPVTVALDFPGADPGGEVRFLVFPAAPTSPSPSCCPSSPLLPPRTPQPADPKTDVLIATNDAHSGGTSGGRNGPPPVLPPSGRVAIAHACPTCQGSVAAANIRSASSRAVARSSGPPTMR